MVWVGDDEEEDDMLDDGRAGAAAGAAAAHAAAAPLTAPSGARMWTPAVAVEGEQGEKQHFPDGPANDVDFDKIISNIGELNDLAGEGIGKVEKDRHGAQRIVMPDPIKIRLFKNGILMFEGPFRPYDDAETKAIIRDFTDVRRLCLSICLSVCLCRTFSFCVCVLETQTRCY